jgi:hypothetical protein
MLIDLFFERLMPDPDSKEIVEAGTGGKSYIKSTSQRDGGGRTCFSFVI